MIAAKKNVIIDFDSKVFKIKKPRHHLPVIIIQSEYSTVSRDCQLMRCYFTAEHNKVREGKTALAILI